ncbi:MAG: branched-chain amino acid ABC transporter permease [Acidimicrobiia bacterium]|nr:branched-chain amino acid ABC transporter permease [Acidimicrobiia bacterium]
MGRRIRIIVGLAMLAAVLLGAFPGLTGGFTGDPAGAQESGDETPGSETPGSETPAGDAPADEAPAERIFGTIKDADGEPIEGVAIIVEINGDTVDEVETAADGTFEVALPGGGTYQVTLDEDSLPDGVALRDPERATLDEVLIRPGQARAVLFAIGESGGAASPTVLERFLNRFVAGLRFGLIIAVAGVGLTLVFGTTGLVNFAQGELVTLGALVAWYLNAGAGGPGWPLILAGVLAVIAGGLFSGLTDLALWRPLRKKHTGPVAAMVVSIGLALFLRHIYLVVFEGQPRPFADYTVQRAWDLGILEIAPRTWRS